MGADQVQPYGDAVIAATVRQALGSPPITEVRRLAGSVANHDFLVVAEDGSRVVLKIGPTAEIAAEQWACTRLAARGVPVPDVLAAEVGGGTLGAPWLILSHVSGGPTDHPAVAEQAGRWMRQVHTLELDGGGPLVLDGRIARGSAGSWAEAVEAQLAEVPVLVEGAILDPRTAQAAVTAVRVDAILGYDGPGVLLHHDLKVAHLFGTAGTDHRLTAIIDWGDAHVGDPAGDLARLSMAGPVVTAAFLAGYGVEPTPALHDLLARYRVLWNLSALAYEFRAGGDWFDAYRTGITADLALLGG